MPFIGLLGSLPWKPLAIIAAVVVLWIGFGRIKGEFEANGALRTQVDSAIEIANSNAATATHAEELRGAQAKIAADAGAKLAAATKRFERERQAMAHTAPADNGPIAPILRRELDRLPGGPSVDASTKSP